MLRPQDATGGEGAQPSSGYLLTFEVCEAGMHDQEGAAEHARVARAREVAPALGVAPAAANVEDWEPSHAGGILDKFQVLVWRGGQAPERPPLRPPASKHGCVLDVFAKSLGVRCTPLSSLGSSVLAVRRPQCGALQV